jgi:hypothetical protein
MAVIDRRLAAIDYLCAAKRCQRPRRVTRVTKPGHPQPGKPGQNAWLPCVTGSGPYGTDGSVP